jgi:RNA polymerase sigma factor (sigma-70 family)
MASVYRGLPSGVARRVDVAELYVAGLRGAWLAAVKIDGGALIANERGYVTTIVRNAMIDWLITCGVWRTAGSPNNRFHLERQAGKKERQRLGASYGLGDGRYASELNRTEAAILADQVAEKLDDRDRQLLVLVYRTGMAVGEAAEHLGMSSQSGEVAHSRIIGHARRLCGVEGPIAEGVAVADLVKRLGWVDEKRRAKRLADAAWRRTPAGREAKRRENARRAERRRGEAVLAS